MENITSLQTVLDNIQMCMLTCSALCPTQSGAHGLRHSLSRAHKPIFVTPVSEVVNYRIDKGKGHNYIDPSYTQLNHFGAKSALFLQHDEDGIVHPVLHDVFGDEDCAHGLHLEDGLSVQAGMVASVDSSKWMTTYFTRTQQMVKTFSINRADCGKRTDEYYFTKITRFV